MKPITDFIDDILTNEGRSLDGHLVIDPGSFQLSTLDPRKIFRFDVYLLIDGIEVPQSEVAVHMATPAEGVFVLYELRGMQMSWKDIDGCRVRTYDARGNVEVDTMLTFYGLRYPPKRCILHNSDGFSRALAAWHTTPPKVEKVEEQEIVVEQRPVSEHDDETAERAAQSGIILLPPVSHEEKSQVSDILARLRANAL